MFCQKSDRAEAVNWPIQEPSVIKRKQKAQSFCGSGVSGGMVGIGVPPAVLFSRGKRSEQGLITEINGTYWIRGLTQAQVYKTL